MLRKGIKIRQERKNFCDIIYVYMCVPLLCACVCVFILLAAADELREISGSYKSLD